MVLVSPSSACKSSVLGALEVLSVPGEGLVDTSLKETGSKTFCGF